MSEQKPDLVTIQVDANLINNISLTALGYLTAVLTYKEKTKDTEYASVLVENFHGNLTCNSAITELVSKGIVKIEDDHDGESEGSLDETD